MKIKLYRRKVSRVVLWFLKIGLSH